MLTSPKKEDRDPLAPYRGREYSNCSGCEWDNMKGQQKNDACQNCVAIDAIRQHLNPDIEEVY